MNVKKNSIVISFAMIFILLLSCFIPSLSSKMRLTEASADDAPHLYYFSDTAHASSYCSRLSSSSASIINSYTLLPEDTPSWNEFIEFIEIYYAAESYTQIRNAYVIFEMNGGLPRQTDDPSTSDEANPLFVSILSDMFAYWKEQGCQIMFICSTPEVLYYNYNSFLDYVDIHVNTCGLEQFFLNVFYRVYLDCGSTNEIRNCTFIFDANLSSGMVGGTYQNCWFFRDYFMPYIRSIYESDIKNRDDGETEYAAVRRILTEKNIQVIYHLNGNDYYDFVQNQTVTYNANNFYNDYLSNSHVYAIGTTQGGTAYSNSWISFLSNVAGTTGVDFPIYIYEKENNYISASYDHIYKATESYSMLYDIIVDFLTDEDLTVYNNAGGRCDVTYSDIGNEEDGWMCYFSGGGSEEDFSIPGWLNILFPEDAAYYREGEIND